MTFNYNAQRSGVGPARTGVRASDLAKLQSLIVTLPGTVDSAPVQLHALRIGGQRRDVVFMTTSYGISLALDPSTGRVLWTYVPPGTSKLEGGPQITEATPVIDPGRRYVYTASPNGSIYKLSVYTGHPVWRRRVTMNPSREKLASALNVTGGNVVVATDGYADIPPYQGHVVTISGQTGRITHVWNSLCSNRHHLIGPAKPCPVSDSAIWGRPGTVVEPWSGNLLLATGNGPFNGRTDWGDSVLELSPKLRLLHNWTPSDQAYLNSADKDLGSTEPALLPGVHGVHLAVQAGKDDLLKLLDVDRLNGTSGGPGPRKGGQLQTIQGPAPAEIVSQPAVWTHAGHIYVFVTDGAGTAAYVLGSNLRLSEVWSDSQAGTSPLIAGGLLYVYNPDGNIVVHNPITGQIFAFLTAAKGHWNSPIVLGGRIIEPTGDANAHQTTGTLYIFHLPGR